MQQQQIG
jgi:hypothetical protein